MGATPARVRIPLSPPELIGIQMRSRASESLKNKSPRPATVGGILFFSIAPFPSRAWRIRQLYSVPEEENHPGRPRGIIDQSPGPSCRCRCRARRQRVSGGPCGAGKIGPTISSKRRANTMLVVQCGTGSCRWRPASLMARMGCPFSQTTLEPRISRSSQVSRTRGLSLRVHFSVKSASVRLIPL